MATETSREQELENELDIVKQQLAAYTGSDQELGAIQSVGRGMTLRLATILHILVKRAPAVFTRSSFHVIFYASRDDGGPDPKIFDIHISRLRGVLRRAGCQGKIDTVWHAGYRATPELVKWVHGLYDQLIPKEK